MSEFETGISFAEYVSVEVLKGDQKIKLSVNPVGQFNPGGCTAFVSVKKDSVLALEKVEDLYEYLLKRIGFDNLEAVVDLDDYSLKGVLEYTKDLEVDDENEWWLNYFKRLEKKVDEFHEALISMNAQLKDLKVNGHDLAALGLKGKAIGEMLETLLKQVMEESVPNEKAALIAAAENRMNAGN